MKSSESAHFTNLIIERFLKSTFGVFTFALIILVLQPKSSYLFTSALYLPAQITLFSICIFRFALLIYYKKCAHRLLSPFNNLGSKIFYGLILFSAFAGALSLGTMAAGSYIEFGFTAPHSTMLSITCAGFTLIGAHNVSFNRWTIMAYITCVFAPPAVWMLLTQDSYHFASWLSVVIFCILCSSQVFANRNLMIENFKVMDSYKAQAVYYKSILNSVPGMVSVFDRNLKYELVNSRVCEFASLDESQIVRRQIGFSEAKSAFRTAVEEFKEKPISDDRMRIQMQRGSEKIWYMMALHKIPKTGQIAVVSIDINNQVLAEEKTLEQRGLVESSARMAAIGELAAGIAHEINNPLAVITLRSEQLIRLIRTKELESTLQAKFLDDLTKIQSVAYRIARIVKGLRSLARDGERDEIVCIKLSDLVSDTMFLLEEKLKSQEVELKLRFKENLFVDCRSTQMAQVLLNLISNSVDAVTKLPEKWIEIDGTEDANSNSVLISITDSGHGVPKELIDQIMTPFFTTKPAGVGTGLGLSIAKRIVSDHRGELSYDPSSPHTRFTIRLPISKNPRPPTT